MNVRTLRASLAVLASLSLVVVLSFLIVEALAIKEEYYVAHADRMRAVEKTEVDVLAISDRMQEAFEKGQAAPPSVELAFARLIDNNQILQSFSDALDPDVQSRLAEFDAELRRFVSLGQQLVKRQDMLAEAIDSFQDSSPVFVKDLRERGLQGISETAFSLTIDVIEFATAQQHTDAAALVEQLDALRNDPRFDAPDLGSAVAFVNNGNAVIRAHAPTHVTLNDVAGSNVAGDLSLLANAIVADNRRTVRRAEHARLLLSICAGLLLLGAGYAVYRLQSSYRELNKINAELTRSNLTLEERVSARTAQLSTAYRDLKESQVQLVQAEKMSSLGEMVAGISHEINTPLWYLTNNSSVIKERLDVVSKLCDVADSMILAVESRSSVNESVSNGLVEMNRLLKDGMKEDIDEAKDLIRDSIDGLEELTTLAQSLKDFSRLDRAQEDVFDVNEGLNKTLLIAKNRIKKKANVHKHYGDLPLIRCSPSQINQIFLNLLTNAADAIEESGEIIVHTWADDDKVEIRIADTGCGIPADLLPRIRDPFFTTKEVGKGTGLGLSIVDQIVTAHGGEFSIESEPGNGTIATVTLPIVPPGALPIDDESDDLNGEAFHIDTSFPGQDTDHSRREFPDAMTA